MQKQGVLIVNLGTPESPEIPHVKKYIKAFLSDNRVIRNQGPMWRILLNLIILRKRAPKSAAKYRRIWTDQGLPILVNAKAQKAHLQKLLPDAVVEYAMTYSEPSIHAAFDKLVKEGVTYIGLFPLFPQYSGTTVDSVFDAVINYGFAPCGSTCKNKDCETHNVSVEAAGAALRVKMLNLAGPDELIPLRLFTSFYKTPAYINFFADKIKNAAHDADGVLFSFHSIPEEYVLQDNDPYPQHCEETVKLIMEAAGVDIPHFMGYQSKFGRTKWLEPNSHTLANELPSKGIKRLLVLAPGFVSDNLETLVDIDEEMRGSFLSSGGEKFTYLPTFNDDITLAHIIKDINKVLSEPMNKHVPK